jgi:fructose-bisphosphate aldolase, class I
VDCHRQKDGGMTLPRLNRLFNTSGRCLDVAIDHGFFGEFAFVRGIEDMDRVVDDLVDAAPDAIQLTAGQAELLQRHGRNRPALVLRTDVANVYGTERPRRLYSLVAENAVEQAVRLDAACVVVNLFDVPGEPELREACIANVQHLRSRCDDVGMPLMVEPLVMRSGTDGEPYGVDGDTERICALVRQAAELGADVIKADPTDDIGAYPRVIEAARKPVLVRGGGRVPDAELLDRTRAVLDAGAAGIVYGRNIIRHEHPRAITVALMAMLHEDASVEDALEILDKHRSMS